MLGAILGVAGQGVGTAGALLKGKQDLKMQNNQNTANLTLAAMQAKAGKDAQVARQKQQQLYLVVALIAFAMLFVGFALYLKKRKN